MTAPNVSVQLRVHQRLEKFLRDGDLIAVPEPTDGAKSCALCDLRGVAMCYMAPCGPHKVYFKNAPREEQPQAPACAAPAEADPTDRPPFTTGQTLPCNSACQKCGSTDIFRKYFDEGEDARPGLSIGAGRSSVFVDRSTSWWRAKHECLIHHCRTCQYYWDSACLPNTTEKERPCAKS